MRTPRWPMIGLALVGGCELYLGNGHDASPTTHPPQGGDTPDAAGPPPVDGPEASSVPPPGAPCTASLPTTATAYVAPQSCALDGHAVPTLVNTDQMRAALVSRWLVCAGSPFANSDEVGLELTDDAHWYKLYLDGAGGLTRGHGFEHEGTYELVFSYDHVQLNMDISGSGTVITAPQFTTDPVKVRLNNEGLFIGDYIRDDDTGACLPAS